MASAGGLLNLIAKGQNNIILTGNPQKSFFKSSYKRYSNFGLQKFRIDYDGQRDLQLTTPSQFSFKFPRYGDLIMDTYLVVNLPDIWSPIYPPSSQTNNAWSAYDYRWIKDIGFQMIQEITITCGGQTLQKYSGAYLSAMLQRDFTTDQRAKFNRMSGNTLDINNPALAFGRVNSYPSAYYTSSATGAEPSIRGRAIYIPIHTWFSLNSGMAFPLICLQYNELYLNVTLRPIQELFQVRDIFDVANNFPYIQPDFNQAQFAMYRFLQTPPSVTLADYENTTTTWNSDVHLLTTQCFLDKEEQANFAKETQNYLVRDVYEYFFENVVGTKRQKLFNSNGMVANWIFYLQRNDVNLRNEWTNYTNWPYENIPGDINIAPSSDPNSPYSTQTISNVGPLINPNGTNTGYFITGVFNSDNQKEILQTMGILYNGNYRETTQPYGVYEYVEPYLRSPGASTDGLYYYNFCLSTDPFSNNPSGAINNSLFNNRGIEFEIATYLPTIDTANSSFNIICDSSGNPIGIYKQNYKLYEYTYNLTVFEERWNVLTFQSGNAGMLYAR